MSLVEKVARAIAKADDREFVNRPTYYNYLARAAISVVIEEAAKAAEELYPYGSAHTYASENSDVYIAQEDACATIARRIRALAKEK